MYRDKLRCAVRYANPPTDYINSRTILNPHHISEIMSTRMIHKELNEEYSLFSFLIFDHPILPTGFA